MLWSQSLYIILLLQSSFVCLVLSFYVWRHQARPGAKIFLWLVMGFCLWMLCYAFQLMSITLHAQLIWMTLSKCFGVIAASLFLPYLLELLGYRGPLRVPVAGFLVIPGATCLLMMTNPWHGWCYHGAHLQASPFGLIMVAELGWWSGLALIYLLILCGLSFAYLFQVAKYGEQLLRKQATANGLAGLVPVFFLLLQWSPANPFRPLLLTHFGVSFSMLLLVWALERYSLFDLMPVARNRLMQHMADGILVLDVEQKLIDLNQAAEKILAAERITLIGLPLSSIRPSWTAFLPVEGKESMSYEVEIKEATQRSVFALRASRILNRYGTFAGYILTLHDISRHKELEEQLLHTATHDALTGLPNRAFFIEHLGRSLARLRRHESMSFAVLFLDLDRFKAVNDNLGHHIGDALLIAVATAFQQCLREVDCVARLGGDEFVILLDEIQQPQQAMLVADRLCEIFETPFLLGEHSVSTHCSIGIVMAKKSYNSPSDLLCDADAAMYQVKQAGRGHYKLFDSSEKTFQTTPD